MKKFGEFIKSHKLLAIIMSAVIFLVALWTPVIIVLTKQAASSENSSLANASQTSSGVFAGNYWEVSSEGSSKDESSGKASFAESTSESSSTSAVSSKNESSSKVSSSSSNSKNESSSKKDTSSQASSSKKPVSQDNITKVEEDPIAKDAPRIICWGDSITQGMGMERESSYPGVLQGLVGYGYRVLNAGSGGEESQTIAARQGAYEVYLKADLVFEEGYGNIRLDDTNGFILEDGTLLDINEDGESFRNDVPCKKVYINGEEYELYANGEGIELLREEYDKKLVLKKGSKVVFESANAQKGSYCEIFYVSANDNGRREGDSEDIKYLINRYKVMINRHGNDNYMVIIPQWAKGYSEPLKAEFGDRAVDIKAEICNRVINKIEFFPTDEDLKEAKEGRIPTSLKYEKNPNDTLHLNEEGYAMMAKIIYENGVKLKFWK